MNVLQIMKSGGLHGRGIGRIGPYPLYMESFESLIENNEVSDEIMDALFHLFSRKRPDVLAINNQTLGHILEGDTRARSSYFTKNIFENKTKVVGPFLEDGNHWTFFHCSIVDRTITYLNSLGETDEQYNKIAENWSTFAASKGYQGPWKRVLRKHSLQHDSISCGVFTAVFAEAILGGSGGYLMCSPIQEERERLGTLLFSSLDRSGICGVCFYKVPRKNKEKCSTCFVNIHKICLPGRQEDAKCLFCKEKSSGEREDEPEGQDRSGEKEDEPETQDRSEEKEGEPEGQDRSGEKEDEPEGQDRSGEREDEPETQDRSGEKEDEPETQDRSEEKEDEPEGQDRSGEKEDEPETQDRSGEKEDEPETQDRSGEREDEPEGQDSSGGSNQNEGIQEESSSGLNQVQGGFLVESVLKVSDSHQAKRYLVTSDELQRRCSPPESYSANTVVAYLRKAKGQKKKITETLAELEVNPSKRTKLTSQCSKLCEDECKDLAGDVMFLATKFIPQKRVGEALLEEGNVHAAIVKTEDCRKTLKEVKAALEKNWDTFDLATHGLGPAVINGTFSLIDACLKEKMRALKKKDSTDE
ncbi:uncharacterized protein LOC125246020 isoform X2 [Megalobrama amblycephala]|uniref:uncharacterized protein LOC125246020 isoform X2 n=2 Tax=Megalobrama amblycephala TaxID=75352 RepID=UPI0020144D02|nr:uncharacterized protein LOC125246020 isoform X2 [Megalobrama amblycephala]